MKPIAGEIPIQQKTERPQKRASILGTDPFSRAILQFSYYDTAVKKEHPFGALFFAVVFLYLSATFIAATFIGR